MGISAPRPVAGARISMNCIPLMAVGSHVLTTDSFRVVMLCDGGGAILNGFSSS